ncbi:MAG: sn-glycerol-3-phosphate ABC transporter ATP-binding protein UgpC [Granulosicoccus sp.]|nr:sn-glycerol-3-phosphate ABC transporter ATP-binding protein UgpC [Granulosicoccus sp.]
MATLSMSGLTKRFGDIEVIRGVDIDIADGEFVVFVGPSGCGKSTLLRMIAGLEDISGGELRIDDHLVNDMQPRDRGIAMVFQTYAIFPHMSVRENLGFGLTIAKVPKAEKEQRVMQAARILQMEHLLDRRPSQLSGGQRQRVAIGRAIVREPSVFLFDEPLSNLDAALRMDMRMEIGKLHEQLGATMIYVTHDQVEAMTLADRIVVIKDGIVQQVGAPMELYHQPANRFVAGFIGSPSMNFLPVEVQSVDHDSALVASTSLDAVRVPMRVEPLKSGDQALLGLRPQYLVPTNEQDAGQLHGTLSLVERLGSETVVDVNTRENTRLVAAIADDRTFETGTEIAFTFDPNRAHLFSAAGDGALNK